ncbi:hypothetical protein [Streptomyces avermitilis]|uniref:hypothetical protein n=1 Tax=Streptomyces avermitilis TaxID=33903 RepID=UPI0033F3C08C
MNATPDQPRNPLAAGGEGYDHRPSEFANAKGASPSSVYFGVLSGARETSIVGWLRLSPGGPGSKAAAAWSEFRQELHADPALNIRPGDALRARKLAAGQGRPRIPSARRGPSRSEQWSYRYVLRRGLEVIAELPGITVGTAHGHGGTTAATTDAFLARLSSRHTAEDTSAIAIVRRNTSTSTWYELTPTPAPAAPHIVQGLPYTSDEVYGLTEAAEFVAYCAYQHHARRHNRRFLWDWFPNSLPGAEGPFEL